METSELLRTWLDMLVTGLDAEVDEEARARVLTHCGRGCALYHGSLERAKAIQQGTQDVDELLDELNQQEGLWCGRWIRDDDIITSICEACGCPLVGAGLVKPSPTFCNCSRGWVEAVFEIVLGRPVTVELKQAIGRGDPVCEFIVRSDAGA
jgi:predicted hydrocarbon binding protein